MQWEHTSSSKVGEKFWHSWAGLELQPRRAVLSTGLSGKQWAGWGGWPAGWGAVKQGESQSTGCKKSSLQRNERKHSGRSKAEDQTSPVDCKMDQVKGGGWRSGTGEMPERCFSSSILDNLVGQEGMRRDGRRDVV